MAYTLEQQTRLNSQWLAESEYSRKTATKSKQSFIDWVVGVGLAWVADKFLTLSWEGIKSVLRGWGIWI